MFYLFLTCFYSYQSSNLQGYNLLLQTVIQSVSWGYITVELGFNLFIHETNNHHLSGENRRKKNTTDLYSHWIYSIISPEVKNCQVWIDNIGLENMEDYGIIEVCILLIGMCFHIIICFCMTI